MTAGKRYSTVTGKEITPADDFADGYAEAMADVVAWLREKARKGHISRQGVTYEYVVGIEHGDARGAARKAGNGAG